MNHKEKEESELTEPWASVHTAVWLIGLAILAWKGWWWPGILVLVAISLIIEAMLAQFGPKATEATVPTPPERRLELLPSSCPKCGAPVRGGEVKWTGPRSAECSYCGANLPVREA
jgi:hypothetical protein